MDSPSQEPQQGQLSSVDDNDHGSGLTPTFEKGETSAFGTTSSGGTVEQETKDTLFVPEKGFYQPSSDETWEGYQGLVSLVEAQVRINLPSEVICGMVDEILSVLKGDFITTPRGKKAEIEKILNPIPDFLFNELVLTSKLITDYNCVNNTSKADSQVPVFVPDKDFYQPKSEATAEAYKLLLDLVDSRLCPNLPEFVQCASAHEILVILKNWVIGNTEKRIKIEDRFEGMVSGETFNQLLHIAGKITDFYDDDETWEDKYTADEEGGNEYLDQLDSSDWFSQRVLEGFQDEAGDEQKNTGSSSEFDDSKDDVEKPVFPIINEFDYSSSDHGGDGSDKNEPVDPI